MGQLLLNGDEEQTPRQKKLKQAEALYKAYPRKKAPRRAIAAAMRALERAPFETILAGVKVYRKQTAHLMGTRDEKFVKYPEGWFNGDRWNDDVDASSARPSTRVMAPDGKYDNVPVKSS